MVPNSKPATLAAGSHQVSGKYVLTVTAVNAAGARSAAETVTFAVVKPPKH